VNFEALIAENFVHYDHQSYNTQWDGIGDDLAMPSEKFDSSVESLEEYQMFKNELNS